MSAVIIDVNILQWQHH